MKGKQEATALFMDYFPNVHADVIEFYAELLAIGLPTSGAGIEVVERQRELERLEKIERLARELWKEYSALPLGVKGKNDVWVNMFRMTYELTGKLPGQHSKSSSEKFPDKVGAIVQIRQAIEAADNMHHKQRDFEFIAKASLVDFARNCWRVCSGENAPLTTSEGAAFFRFLADLIEFSGKNWGVDRCFSAWRKWQAME